LKDDNDNDKVTSVTWNLFRDIKKQQLIMLNDKTSVYTHQD